MFCFLSFLTICKFRKSNNKASRYITREDLDVKLYKTGVTKKAIKPVYDHDMKNASPYDVQSRGGTTRVKVVMTKDEAMILFSQCDRGGTLSFENVATSLTNIPANRVSLVCTSSPSYQKPMIMLESIPEEP
ncbi:hypothetical protein QVD17_13532 [Tagetes erecta]|uniref:DUF7890 domain-containing protein n=1 Tax=Tagetes erecta TaxID=13708 RepID=A0AAD8L0S3_TARER|nr:hypothetical protein QVD17_13532 [Tagetes erecta]